MNREEQIASKKNLIRIALIYWLVVIISFLVAGNAFRYSDYRSDTISPLADCGELVDGSVIRQYLDVTTDELYSVELILGTYGRANTGTLNVKIIDPETSEMLTSGTLDISAVSDNTYQGIWLNEPVRGYKGKSVLLEVSTVGCNPGNAITLYYGNSVSAGRFTISGDMLDLKYATLNGSELNGQLCFASVGRTYSNAIIYYWGIATIIFAIAAVYTLAWGWKGYVSGNHNAVYVICAIMGKYSFLLRQLVSRDFKVKYKRSVLGMAWSFLNPLLTMAVQYVVFSTLFKSNIPNYVVYLLTGIIFFNYFSETVSLGMTSITGNASLINKVYLPKYIYPVSKVFSSFINFALSLIPLFLVMLFTGTRFHLSMILLVYDLICFIGFVIGMVLILSTLMVFFRDVQFLWSVLSMVWMYLTPIFYPASIIPERFLTLYKMNPMYQYITFARIVIIDGVSPGPTGYLWCLLCAIVSLTFGIIIFKKQKEKFILYI